MIEWKPIETAPKDRAILGYYGKDPAGRGDYGVAWWDTDKYCKRPKPYWSGNKEQRDGKRFLQANPPTHWAELTPPEAP